MSDSVVAARELRTLVTRLRRRMREAGGIDDLSVSQTAVMSRLATDGPATASALAAAERVRPQSMAALVRSLEEQGLVRRTPDPDDGRRQTVALTRQGSARVEGSRAARDEWMAKAFARDFTADERQQVLAALRLLERLL